MICPRCNGNMVEKEKLCREQGEDGKGIVVRTQKVMFCRDCLATAMIKK